MPSSGDQILQTLLRGVVDIVGKDQLRAMLAQSCKPRQTLVVKAGFDPTAPDIHLGHVVLLKKLRQFQDAGHRLYFLIGDFTAQIGDPSGRDQSRPKMNPDEIKKNAQTYKAQVFKILDSKKTKVVFNSRWLMRLSSQDICDLASHCTVAQMLARADFKKRYEEQKEISMLEFLYPLLQAYDSVCLKADIELGGSDQKFNLLMGRQLQEAYGMKPQVVLMMPLLEGTDGSKKMSKSLGNYIGINETPCEIFGKIMSISDSLMMRYYELLTEEDLNVIKEMHPKEAKMHLAEGIVKEFCGVTESLRAREHFQKVFSQKEVPDEIPVYQYHDRQTILEVLVDAHIVPSKSEARRLIKQNAVSLDGSKIYDEQTLPSPGILKVGKRRFCALKKP